MVFDKVVILKRGRRQGGGFKKVNNKISLEGNVKRYKGQSNKFQLKISKNVLGRFLFIQSVLGFAPSLILRLYKNDFRHLGLTLLFQANYFWL